MNDPHDNAETDKGMKDKIIGQLERRGGLMGKYSHITPNLPKVPSGITGDEEEGGFQDRVDQAKLTLQGKSPSELAEILFKVRLEKATAKEVLSEINVRVGAVEQMIVDVYEAEGITTIKLTGFGSVRTEAAPHAVTVDKEACRLWCIENGYQNEMVLPWMTLNSIVKERLLEGEPEPDGVKAYVRTTVKVTSEK